MSHNEWLRREIGMRYGCLVALTFALSGCIGYSWTTENTDAYSQFSQGVVYELQRTVWVNVDNGHASKNKVFEKSIEVQKGTTIRVDHVVLDRGVSFWWYFGPYAYDEVFGVVMDGEWKGQKMSLNGLTSRCRKWKNDEWQMYDQPDEEWLKRR